MTELMVDYLKLSYPIKRMRLPHKKMVYHGLPTKGNFKRVIEIGGNLIFRVSDTGDRYNAMYALSIILCRTFHVTQEETLPILKKYLHLT